MIEQAPALFSSIVSQVISSKEKGVIPNGLLIHPGHLELLKKELEESAEWGGSPPIIINPETGIPSVLIVERLDLYPTKVIKDFEIIRVL